METQNPHRRHDRGRERGVAKPDENIKGKLPREPFADVGAEHGFALFRRLALITAVEAKEKTPRNAKGVAHEVEHGKSAGHVDEDLAD